MKFFIHKREKNRAPDYLLGALFGGAIGVIIGLMLIAALRNVGYEMSWQNPMAFGAAFGSAVGLRWPWLGRFALDCFQALWP